MSSHQPISKRHISFYNKEFASVCSGINLKSRCGNGECESVRTLGGLVMVKCPDLDACVFQDVVYNLLCPACGSVLDPQQFSGVVFVRCEAEISVGAKSDVLRASQEETVLWGMQYLGPEVRISILEREQQAAPPVDVSKNYLFPTNGVNLVGTCPRNDCFAFKNNQGLVVVRVGLIESAVFQELTKFRNCSCCNRELQSDSFKAVTFLGCRAEVEIGGKIETFDATATPKPFKLEAAGPRAIIRVNRDSAARSPQSSTDRPRGLAGLSPSAASEGFEKFVRNVSSGMRNVSSEMEPGINFLADCPSADCDAVVIPAGHILSCKYKEAIRGKICPTCRQALPPSCFKGVGFLQCTASVQSGGKESVYRAGRIVEICKIHPEGNEVEITVQERDMGGESTGSLSEGKGPSSVRVCSGLNVEAMCINPKCNASIVVIPCPRVDECQYFDLISTLQCPSCSCSIPAALFIGISLVQCKAEVTIGSQYQSVKAAGDETKDFRLELGGPPVFIKILTRDLTPKTGQLSGGSGMEYTSACTGLNIVAVCDNSSCLAYTENDGQINIKVPDKTNCLLSEAAANLRCPSCDRSMGFSQVKAITFVRCSGEVFIGNQCEKFTAAGDKLTHFAVSSNSPEVRINILSKFQVKKDQQSSERKYTKVCDGVNFIAFCQNPICLSVQEYDGYVNVRRDQEFIRRGGFPPNRCNYSQEIQNLKCPSCEARLDPKIARGVALVRCKGTIEIGGKSQNFEAKLNDFKEFTLDHSDSRTFVEYQVVELLPHGPGLNVIIKCPNKACPCQNHPLLKEVAIIKFGIVRSCKVNEAIRAANCPLCNHNIPMDNFVAVLFNACAAVVKIEGKETTYMVGARVQTLPYEFSENIEVDILPVIAREVSTKQAIGNPFGRLLNGMNVQAVCSNRACEAKRSYEGQVNISCPEMKKYSLRELFPSLNCPSCRAPLSQMFLTCLSFVQCKALLQTSARKYLVEAGKDEAIDFESASLTPDFSIHVLSLDQEFPDSFGKGAISKGSEFSHASVCHGLNFRASCSNPACIANKRSQYVNIMAGHLLDFDYRAAVQSLSCPACQARILPDEVGGVTMLCCTGEVRFGDRVEKFDYSGERISRINIPSDGSRVWIKVEHRTYDIITHPVLPYMHRPFQALCNGVNFRCYCKNPLCGTFREREGLVMVQRDPAFAQAHGYPLSVCSYRQEISSLKCPDCAARLRPYYVWGVLFTCCSGSITRNGSPPEKFSTLLGKVVLYALDRDDTSVRIDFSL